MNRLDRITANLIHLQSKRLVIAKEMAERNLVLAILKLLPVFNGYNQSDRLM
ncbi:hypothetical protein JMN32_15710 [Fulvivirga sp. 29W222]|uniref:Uncharacterized protein n=1 Tax=Fulvivirga marina TaxID=2494733 RepID=A0A937G0J8_9BACT|nr:hypothetical protein [Fulvivirga marina]MBL6447765.1 hypothetical protein [Fulvivirga marina]